MLRHQGIYNLLYEIRSRKDRITDIEDRGSNNMLHLLALTTVKMRSRTSGASLLMQRELLWFKEIEKMLPAHMRENKNANDQTAYELFSEMNADLVTRSLDWMKDCMVVATLIVTVAFAVAFTVPGAYGQTEGLPIFIHDRAYLVFVIADAISLFSSSTSLLVFLSILTSRHGQHDFMYSLPSK
ncbi:ankyrin repeat-containing protein [Tanacetum coccineum]